MNALGAEGGQLERALAAQAQPVNAVNVAPILTIVVPTLNERDNIKPLIALLDATLPHIAWEVMFVDDDSTDETARHIRALALADPRVRCVQRIGRRGLSTACIEGVLACSAPYVAVMDADLQHDEALLPRMLDILQREPVDLVIGSRYAAGGSFGDWASRRARISQMGTKLARLICKQDISDPLSGFFMCRRDAFESAVRRLSGQGFKILLDLLAS
jgi:dolichol-phosphate mannosyltransferase